MPDAALRDELHDLYEFLYRVPVGVLRFRGDGTIELLNAMASQMLMPLVRGTGLDNIFHALRLLCPDLQEIVAGFAAPAGTILDQRHIEAQANGQNVTLSLSVSRVHADCHMAVLNDITRLTRMLAYAFAAADLLLDVDEQGRIGWAGGAFRSLLGMRPEQAVGRRLVDLIAPGDRDHVVRGLIVMNARGRLPPLLVHLANDAAAPCVVSGLVMEGISRRCMITIGRPPSDEAAPTRCCAPARISRARSRRGCARARAARSA